MKFQQGDVIKPLPDNPYSVTTGNTEWIVVESWASRIRIVRNRPGLKDIVEYAKECYRGHKDGTLTTSIFAVNAKDFILLVGSSRTNKSLKSLLKENEDDLVEKKHKKSESVWNVDHIPF